MSPRKIPRRAFLARAGIGGGAILTGYSGLCEPQWLDIGRHSVKTNSGSGPITLLHLSDLHASWCVNLRYIEEALKLGLQQKPDLICLTGDFITTTFDDCDGYGRVLSLLSSAAPTYAVLGNHDGGRWARHHGGHENTEWVRKLLASAKIELLHNRSIDVPFKQHDIRLIGVGDYDAGEVDAVAAFAADKGGQRPYTVLLAHNPDTKDLVSMHRWDLMLSGHTHGGQFWLPLIGAPFNPVIDKRFLAGMYYWQSHQIHITKGVGNVYGLRFNCRPEISLLTLT